MLPNHSPLIIAEQFGTLASLYPDRIDLGLGRAPGTDRMTWQALRRHASTDVNDFPRDVVELQHYLRDPQEAQRVIATPGAGTNVPIWILGSSLFGAQLAAMLGLPFAFASHFAPTALDQAIAIYREKFEPSEQLSEPYVMLGYNVCVAPSDKEATHLRTSSLQANCRPPLPITKNSCPQQNDLWCRSYPAVPQLAHPIQSSHRSTASSIRPGPTNS